MKTVGSNSKTYLMVLPVPYYRVDGQTVALESAFAGHLKLLKQKASLLCEHLTIAMVEMTSGDYERKKQSLTVIDELQEGITFKTLYKSGNLSSRARQLSEFFKVSARLKSLIESCDILHTGLSANLWFPVEFVATLWGALLKKPMVYVVDIDFRKTAQMSYATGTWSFKSYLLCKYVYDQFRAFQVKFAVEHCALTLLKGKKLCKDFGKGKPNVKNFLDAAHSAHHIIGQEALAQKLSRLQNPNRPLEIVYFGRLTPYKGVDRCLQAVAIAHQKFGCDVTFHVVGDGEQAGELKQLAQSLGISDRVFFYGALPFNQAFFKRLYTYHLLLAAPMTEDTPRSALDAMAAGMPILAFDTYYYRDLAVTGAVDTVPWLSVEQFAEKIAYYDAHREQLAEMSLKAVEFARHNTQEEWLDRRFDWTLLYAGLPQREINRPAYPRELYRVS